MHVCIKIFMYVCIISEPDHRAIYVYCRIFIAFIAFYDLYICCNTQYQIFALCQMTNNAPKTSSRKGLPLLEA